MSCDNINITTGNDNTVNVISQNNNIIVVNECDCSIVNIPQSVTTILQVNSPGPQGPAGPIGNVDVNSLLSTSSFNSYTGSSISQFAGTSSYASTASYALNAGAGSGFPFSGSAVITGSLLISGSGLTVIGNQTITGSFIISGSSTFTNIGPAIFSGSVTTTAGFTGSLFGTAVTASYILQAESASFATTASYALSSSYAFTSSFASTASFATTVDTSYVLRLIAIGI